MQGTPFLSAEERDWFTQTVGQRPQYMGQPSGPTTMANSPITPPQTGGGGPRYRPSGTQGEYVFAAQNAANQYGVDPNLFTGLLAYESGGWNPQATNPTSGAAGLGQFLPSTAAQYGTTPDRLRSDPYHAIDLSARLMSDNIRTFQGNQLMGAAAYFIGPKNIQDAVMKGGAQGWLQAADQIALQYGQGTVTNWLQSIGAI